MCRVSDFYKHLYQKFYNKELEHTITRGGLNEMFQSNQYFRKLRTQII